MMKIIIEQSKTEENLKKVPQKYMYIKKLIQKQKTTH
jgi:hypothetical protein